MPEKPDGWYPDPDSPDLYRRWDGSQWTSETMPRKRPLKAGWHTHPETGVVAFYDGTTWLDIPPPPAGPELVGEIGADSPHAEKVAESIRVDDESVPDVVVEPTTNAELNSEPAVEGVAKSPADDGERPAKSGSRRWLWVSAAVAAALLLLIASVLVGRATRTTADSNLAAASTSSSPSVSPMGSAATAAEWGDGQPLNRAVTGITPPDFPTTLTGLRKVKEGSGGQRVSGDAWYPVQAGPGLSDLPLTPHPNRCGADEVWLARWRTVNTAPTQAALVRFTDAGGNPGEWQVQQDLAAPLASAAGIMVGNSCSAPGFRLPGNISDHVQVLLDWQIWQPVVGSAPPSPSPSASTVDWVNYAAGISTPAPPPFPDSLPGYTLNHSGEGTQWVRPQGWHAVESTTLPVPGPESLLPLTHSSNKCGVEYWLLRWQSLSGALEAGRVRRNGTSSSGYSTVSIAQGEATYRGNSGYLSGDNCTSPGFRNPGTSPVRVVYQWQRYAESTGGSGSSVTAASGEPIASTAGLTDMTNFDPETAEAIVTSLYSKKGAPLSPVQCFKVESTNSSPDYAYFTISDMAASPQRDPACHPSDDTMYVMRLVGSTWQDTGRIYGVNPTWTCSFQGALPFVSDAGARKDLCG